MKNILCCFVLLFSLLLKPMVSHAQKKPNVIFVVVDDLSIEFDAYGNPDVSTPNFARLMSHGVFFKNTYVQYALCSPSRTSFLSALRPDRTGIFFNGDDPRSHLGTNFRFLPEFFHDYGYRTERFGKVGPCHWEPTISWDYVVEKGRGNSPVPGADKTAKDGYWDAPHWWIDTATKTESQNETGMLTDSMIGKINNPVATPYFYALGLTTHAPYEPIIQDWNKTGDAANQKLLPVDIKGTLTNVRGNGSGNITLKPEPLDDSVDIPKIANADVIKYTPQEQQDIRHAYYGEIMQMDIHLGVLLDDLDKKNVWDSSIVVFISDHGVMMGEHGGNWLKLCIWEECNRIPLIVCAPGKKRGVVCNQLVEAVDLFPTLNELAGLPAPTENQGSSFVPLMENPDAAWKRAIFSQVIRFPPDGSDSAMGYAVRTSQFQYSTWQEYGEELYDIVNDPNEYTNLAINHPEHLADLNQMRTIYSQGWTASKPPVYTKSTFYKDADGDGFGTRLDTVIAYFAPDGYITKAGDCDDTNPKINPGAKEKACNGKDDNCDGRIDENKPVPTITPLGSLDICQAGSVVLKSVKGAGLTYQWLKDGANIAGATAVRYTATVKGAYKVLVTNTQNGCSNYSDAVTVTNSCGAIASGTNSSISVTSGTALQFSLYPNPSAGNINVSYTSNTSGTIKLKVLDVVGKVLMVKSEQATAGNNNYKLNLSNLKSGTYSLEVYDGAISKHVKFVIEK